MRRACGLEGLHFPVALHSPTPYCLSCMADARVKAGITLPERLPIELRPVKG